MTVIENAYCKKDPLRCEIKPFPLMFATHICPAPFCCDPPFFPLVEDDSFQSLEQICFICRPPHTILRRRGGVYPRPIRLPRPQLVLCQQNSYRFRPEAVIPAKAGIQFFSTTYTLWTPACAGVTTCEKHVDNAPDGFPQIHSAGPLIPFYVVGAGFIPARNFVNKILTGSDRKPSFPRRRESSLFSATHTLWTPACAG
jgi:hypothetical protein